MPDNDNHLSGGDGFHNGEDTIQDILACELRINFNIWILYELRCHVILEALFSMQSNENPPRQPIPRGTRLISLSGVDLRDLARYVTIRRASNSSRGINRLVEEEEEEDEGEYEEDEYGEDEEEYDQEDQEGHGRQWFPPATEAQKEGEELLYSGDFGRVGIKIRSRANNGNLVKSLLNQASHPIPNLNKEDLLTVGFNFPPQNHELNLFYPPEPSSKFQWNCSCNLRCQHVHRSIFKRHIDFMYKIRIMSNFSLCRFIFLLHLRPRYPWIDLP